MGEVERQLSVDWDEIGDIVDDAYRLIAPTRLIAELDGTTK